MSINVPAQIQGVEFEVIFLPVLDKTRNLTTPDGDKNSGQPSFFKDISQDTIKITPYKITTRAMQTRSEFDLVKALALADTLNDDITIAKL